MAAFDFIRAHFLQGVFVPLCLIYCLCSTKEFLSSSAVLVCTGLISLNPFLLPLNYFLPKLFFLIWQTSWKGRKVAGTFDYSVTSKPLSSSFLSTQVCTLSPSNLGDTALSPTQWYILIILFVTGLGVGKGTHSKQYLRGGQLWEADV